QEFLRNEALKSGLKSAMSNFEISRNKYSQGLINYTDVLNSQMQVYSLENDFVSSEGQKIINLIALFKSLGGGWRLLE
ncbi:MAG: TolC family protein, partial [Synergistaceae bacterium]|nr:TolC family protein [Synergistaceae bacterium]